MSSIFAEVEHGRAAAESASLDCGIQHAHDKPDPTRDLGRLRQAPPDPKAEHERQRRYHEVGQPLAAVVRGWVEPVHADGRGVAAAAGLRRADRTFLTSNPTFFI